MEITQIKPSVFKVKTKLANITLENGVTVEAKKGIFEIKEPGEYEVEGVSTFGYGIADDNVYLVQAENLRVLYFAKLEKEMTEAQIEELGNVDAMLIPVGAIETKLAVKMVEAVEPTYVLPYEAGVPVASFVAAYEHGSREASSLSITAATMPTDVTEVVVLSVK